MSRRPIRRQVENRPVVYNNFSKGMEYHKYAKDANNPRANFIKNMEVTSDGKLKTRKPLIPLFVNNGDFGRPRFSKDFIFKQAFYFPHNTSTQDILWLGYEKGDPKFIYTTGDENQISDVNVPFSDEVRLSLIEHFRTNDRLDWGVVNETNTLYIKLEKGVIIIRNTTVSTTKPSITVELLTPYRPTISEVADPGLNLLMREPFVIGDTIDPTSLVSIGGIYAHVRKDGKYPPFYQENYKYLINPTSRDDIYLKLQLGIPESFIQYELLTYFNPDGTMIANAFDGNRMVSVGGNSVKVKTLWPTISWYRKTISGSYPKTADRFKQMPFIFLFIGNNEQLDLVNKIGRSVIKTGWSKFDIRKGLNSLKKLPFYSSYSGRSDVWRLGPGANDSFTYKAEVTFPSSGYATSSSRWETLTVGHLDDAGQPKLDDGTTVKNSFKGAYVGDTLRESDYIYTQTGEKYDNPSKFNTFKTSSGQIFNKANLNSVFDPEGKKVLIMTDWYTPWEASDDSTGTNSVRKNSNNTYHKLSLIFKDNIIITDIEYQYVQGKLEQNNKWTWEWSPDKGKDLSKNSYWETNWHERGALIKTMYLPGQESSWSNEGAYRSIFNENIQGIKPDLLTGRIHYKRSQASQKSALPKNGSFVTGAWKADIFDKDSNKQLKTSAVTDRYSQLAGIYELDGDTLLDWVTDSTTLWVSDDHDKVNQWFNMPGFGDHNVKFTLTDYGKANIKKLNTLGSVTQVKKHMSIPLSTSIDSKNNLIYNSTKMVELYIDANSSMNNWKDNDRNEEGFSISCAPVMISGIRIKVKDATALIPVSFEAKPISFSRTDDYKPGLEKFSWDLLNTKHLGVYWGQLALYGYPEKQDVDGYRPLNYVALSDEYRENYFPSTKALDAYNSSYESVTKIIPYQNNLLAFTPTSATMFVGKIPQSKYTVRTDFGVEEQYRETIQVVSNSVVFKNGSGIYAFVPRNGTEGATSLATRHISEQIKPYIEELDSSNPTRVFSVGYREEYWLVYTFDKQTIILKYNWSKFSWIVDTYNVQFDDILKITTDKLIAIDIWGVPYEIYSKNANKFYRVLTENIKANRDELLAIYPNARHLLDITDDVNKLSGFNQDAISPENYEGVRHSIRRLLSVVQPIEYELDLGHRKTTIDTAAMIDDVTILVSNQGNSPLLEQKFDITADNHRLAEYSYTINSGTFATSNVSAQTPWQMGISTFSNTPVDKHTRNVFKSADTINVVLSGKSPQEITIDSIMIRWAPDDRKSFR